MIAIYQVKASPEEPILERVNGKVLILLGNEAAGVAPTGNYTTNPICGAILS
jgi:hypothetical protein